MSKTIDITVGQIEGSTGGNPNDLFYRSYLTGPAGARYELFREQKHTTEDVEKAKRYLRKNFDVQSIDIIPIRHVFTHREALDKFQESEK